MPEKIEELTPEQDAQLEVYAERFTQFGLSTEPIDHARAEEIIAQVYKSQGLKSPAIEWCQSPFAMVVRGAYLEFMQKDDLHVGKKKEDVEKEADVLFDVSKTLSEEAQVLVRDLIGQCGFGQQDANWLGWLDYYRNELKLFEETEEIAPLIETAKELHWFLPFENVCLCSERPLELHLKPFGDDGIKILHNELGMALRYADDFGIFCLNGVEVTEDIVVTPPDKLPSKMILKETNAEIRREIVRKIGIEKICRDLNAKVIDKMDDYELLMLDLQDGRHRPYLKMKNPSIGTYHVEGVHPNCKTVKEALAWRNGLEIYYPPEILT